MGRNRRATSVNGRGLTRQEPRSHTLRGFFALQCHQVRTFVSGLSWAPPDAPRIDRFFFTEADYLMWRAIDRHGPLPSHYLIDFQKEVRSAATHIKNRLTELCRGSREQGVLLRAPEQQFAQFNAHARHKVYELTPASRLLLAERGMLGRHSPGTSHHWLHQLMQACVTASIELAATERGYTFITRDQIFAHAQCPEATRKARNPLAIPITSTTHLIPDDVFGLYVPDRGYQFFLLEIDRNTESIERKELGQTAFGRKLDAYRDILEERIFARWFGFQKCSVLTVTTNATHAENILDNVRKTQSPTLARRFAIAVQPDFGRNWRVPPEVLPLLNEPWLTATGTRDITAA